LRSLVEGFANMGRTEGSGPAAAFRRQAAERLPEIDKAGIDVAVLSLFQPGNQGERDAATAIRKAKAVNDRHVKQCDALPERQAARVVEILERAVNELGFKGALVPCAAQKVTRRPNPSGRRR
jgi:predicted TIM-barrel fold metal-dependent hydrolase